MSKQFETIAEFIDVISNISVDGSVTIDLSGGAQSLPEEKQYPFVKEAQSMDLLTAMKKMPTALRFDLIREGYDYLVDDLMLSELDGPNDYWPGRMTSYLLRKFPELEPKLNWSKLKNTWLAQVLVDQPQFADKVDFSKLDVRSFAELISKRPEFSSHFDFSTLNTKENAQFWYKILEKQPQFAALCDWTFINDYQKLKLKEKHPELHIV